MKEIGADIAVCYTFRHDPCYHILTGNGFLNRGQSFSWIIRKVVEDLLLDVQDVRNWSLTRGDSDGV